MSFADPQTVTVATIAKTLPRISSGPSDGTFQTADGEFQMAVSHSYGKRVRRSVRLVQKKTSADPFIPDRNIASSMTCYFTVDTPVNGFSISEAKAVADALVAYLTASTGARVTQLLGGEN